VLGSTPAVSPGAGLISVIRNHKKQKAPPFRWGLHFPAQNQEGIAGKTATEIRGMRVNETLMRGPRAGHFD